MKKIYSFALAAVAILSVASCQQELANEALENIGGGNFTVTAATAETKTTLAEDGFGVVWTPGDKISVFNAEGDAVPFSTDITANAATAEFTNDAEFVAPEEALVAVYPHRVNEEGAPVQTYLAGIVQDFRMAGTQAAVAGGFDPAYAAAIGLPKADNPTELLFKNIHSLVKFTIEGEEVPTEVKLVNNGDRLMAGLYSYVLADNSISHSGNGAKEITMTGTFESGKTYYFAVIPGVIGNGFSLYYDGKLVVNTGETVTLEENKIYNLGSYAVPAPEPVVEDPFILEKVVARYSDADGNAWCSFIPGIANRTMACDGKNVYLQSSEAGAKIYAVDVASLISGAETPTYKLLNVEGISGGTHAVSALRCIPNESGDPILIATNLAVDDSQNFNIYAYSNGTDAAPVLFHAYRWDGLANGSDWRRYGDRISVSGTWQDGAIWAASQSGTKVMGFHIENGATNGELREYCWFDTFAGGLAEATMYPGSDEAIVTTASTAQFWTKSTGGETHAGGNWPKWNAGNVNPDLNGAFSFQFFEFGGKKYIAYVKMHSNSKADLVVVEDKGSLEESLASTKFFNIPLYDGEQATCIAGNTYGDCAVVTINDKLHIVAMQQGGGLSIFEIKAK